MCKIIPFQYVFLLVGAVFMHRESAGIGMLYLFASSHMMCVYIIDAKYRGQTGLIWNFCKLSLRILRGLN
jgi:hypothetical protein